MDIELDDDNSSNLVSTSRGHHNGVLDSKAPPLLQFVLISKEALEMYQHGEEKSEEGTCTALLGR